MWPRRWWRAGVVVLLVVVLRHATGHGAAPDTRRWERPSFDYRGAGSCSATACHGSATPSGPGVLRNEHTTWVTQDKHSNAYQVLFTERSAAMAKALGLGPAHESERCLVCHSTPASRSSATVLERDGVSCEACHGPADGWIGPHTTGGWNRLSVTEKEDRFGLFATKDVARRAEACASCHVGEPARDGRAARDVNHDLIAAGHPALRFEFAAYLALMPPHWVEKGRNAEADFHARAWAVGQVATAKAALDLLANRATNASTPDTRGPWPELAEYSCFSCHRPIESVPTSFAGSARSSPPWGTWYHTFAPRVAGEGPFGRPVELEGEIAALQRLMEQGAPDSQDVSRHARRAADACGAWLAASRGKSLAAPAVRGLATTVNHFEPADWDSKTQHYLASTALRQAFAALGANPEGLLPDEAALRRMRDELRFPAGFDRPRVLKEPAAPGEPGVTAAAGRNRAGHR